MNELGPEHHAVQLREDSNRSDFEDKGQTVSTIKIVVHTTGRWADSTMSSYHVTICFFCPRVALCNSTRPLMKIIFSGSSFGQCDHGKSLTPPPKPLISQCVTLVLSAQYIKSSGMPAYIHINSSGEARAASIGCKLSRQPH